MTKKRQFFIDAKKFCNAGNLTENNVVRTVMEYQFNKFIKPIDMNARCTDKELHPAMPWSDYGNYPSYCLNPEHEFLEIKINGTRKDGWCMQDWDDLKYGKDVLILVDVNSEIAYHVCRQGNEYNHSENNNCPGRMAVGEQFQGELPKDIQRIVDYYKRNKDSILNDFILENGRYQEECAFNEIKKLNEEINGLKDEISHLRKNAYKKRERLENDLYNKGKRLSNVERKIITYPF